MKKLYVQDVLEKTKGEVLCGKTDVEIGEISIDTRTLEKGQTYLALKGENVDGTVYCKNAINKGAKVCFVQENIFTKEELTDLSDKVTIVKVENVEDALVEMAKIKRVMYNIPVVAITGSVGKTSTKEVIASVMEQKFNVQKTKGNQNNRLGLPITIMGLKDHDALVIEMGMNHAGELSELTQIAKPTLCVISNIGTSHIGNLGSRENILKAKLEILEGMKSGKVIINNDNDLLHKWNKEDDIWEKVTFGINETSNYQAKDIKMNETGNQFTIEINSKKYEFTTKTPGEPFILNALSAISVGMQYGIEPEKMQKAISETNPGKNRMDIENINDITIIKDYYNASLESIKPSLEYLSKLKGGKKIAVLGDIKEVGDYSKQLHEQVGEETVKNNIDILITVGKEAEHIANSAISQGMLKENIFPCKNNLQAVNKLKKIAQKKDKILLKASNSMKFGEILDGYINKIKVGIVVGGMSSEHDVSLMSGNSILEKIDKEKYDIKVIYIKRNGNVYEYTGPYEKIREINQSNLIPTSSIIEAVKDCQVVFPVLHGKYGEDGCIQGALEMIEKPYVGCGVFTSSACMDKEFTKKILTLAEIPVAKSITVQKEPHYYSCDLEEKEYTLESLCKKAEDYLHFPMFIKPSREGSSFGVTRAANQEELMNSIKEAEKYDNKILIEEEIKGREVECAVLGNSNILTSEVGEVKSAESFYTFDAKYNNQESRTEIPAKIKPEHREKIKKYAKLAYKAVNGTGLSRVDFFIRENGDIILNEINTLPGFTKISMYPKLFEAVGISYSSLIDILIELAIEK